MSNYHHVERFGNLEVDFGRFFGKDTDAEFAFYKRAVDRVAQIDGEKLSLQAAGKLTPAGIKEKLAESFAELAKAHAADRQEIERELADAVALTDQIALRGVQKLEPGDAVGELRDQELRRWWREQDAETKAALLTEMQEGKHPAMASALLRGHELITGLLPERRTLLQNALLPLEQKQQLENVRNRIKRLQCALEANIAGYTAMRQHAGLTPKEARQAQGLPTLMEEARARHGLVDQEG